MSENSTPDLRSHRTKQYSSPDEINKNYLFPRGGAPSRLIIVSTLTLLAAVLTFVGKHLEDEDLGTEDSPSSKPLNKPVRHLPKHVITAVNGVCDKIQNSCKVGLPRVLSSSEWECIGNNGGRTEPCDISVKMEEAPSSVVKSSQNQSSVPTLEDSGEFDPKIESDVNSFFGEDTVIRIEDL